MNISEALVTGTQTTIIGLTIVFAVLIIIMYVLKLFEVIFSEKKSTPSENVAAVKQAEDVQAVPVSTQNNMTEEQLIAVLTAAVAASLNTSTYNLQIKSYRRVGNSRPSWNKAGVTDTINNRF